jgi:hypothetical protein
MGASPHIDDDRGERGAAAVVNSAVTDALYGAALAALLDEASRRPGVLERLCSLVRRLHARRRSDGRPLPPEYWFGST